MTFAGHETDMAMIPEVFKLYLIHYRTNYELH